MAKDSLTLHTDDLSGFTRELKRQLVAAADPPSHLTLMNMLARAAGFRNLQHLRADQAAGRRMARSQPTPDPVDQALVERTLSVFDPAGRMLRWPARQSVQDLAFWVLWAQLPAGQTLTERQVNDHLDRLHSFGDRAILRRSLVTQGHMTRTLDGAAYDRVERPPTATAQAVISALRPRWTG